MNSIVKPFRRNVVLIVGTRPEAIKMAPLVCALRREPWCQTTVISTAQHREMLDQVLTLFEITPDHDLDLLRAGQSLSALTGRALSGLEPLLAQIRPDIVVVQGDTTTTFAGALAAFYQQIPVAHLEAGLRTFDPYSPYPEEINRRLTSQLANLHLAATSTGRNNLLLDGIGPDRIVVTGNTVIDALHWSIARPARLVDPQLEQILRSGKRIILVTAHRRESWGAGMRNIASALSQVAEAYPDVEIVFPVHRNPVVRAAMHPELDRHTNVSLIDPLDYREFCRLLDHAHLVLTDSGGIQEEAPSLGKPVLVLRDTTERPEAVAAGAALLVGTNPARIVAATAELLDDVVAYAAMSNAVSPYGDGRASERAVASLAHFFGLGERPLDFGDPVDGFRSPDDQGWRAHHAAKVLPAHGIPRLKCSGHG